MYQEILVFANQLLNTITAGTYLMRPILFVAYFLVILTTGFLLRWFLRTAHGAKLHALTPHIRRVAAIITVSSFSLVFLINVFLQVIVFNHFGIPERALATALSGGEITNTRLIHIHFGKIVVATAFASPTQGIVLRADTGRALVPYVPRAVAWLEIAVFFIGLLASGVATAFYLCAQQGRRKYLFATIMLSVLGFLVIEKSVDGGIFSDGAGFALLAYTGLLLLPLKRCVRIFPYFFLGYLWILTILYVLGYYWPQSYFEYTLERLAILVVVVIVAVTGMLGMWKHLIISIALLVAGVTLFVYVNDAGDRAYLNTSIAPGAQYVSAYPEEVQPALPMVGSIGQMNVYDTSPLAPASIKSVLERFNLPPAYYPVTNGSYTCVNPVMVREERFDVLSPSRLTDVESNGGLFSSHFAQIYPVPSGWYRYHGTISYNPCVTRYLDVLEQVITLAGSDTAIIYNLEFYSVPNRSN